jgi:hypothetical protein
MKFPTAIGVIVAGARKRVLWLMHKRNSGLSRDLVDPGLRSRILGTTGSPGFSLCRRRRSPKGLFALSFAGDVTPKYNLTGHAFGGALLWPRNMSNGG